VHMLLEFILEDLSGGEEWKGSRAFYSDDGRDGFRLQKEVLDGRRF